jgi:LacI family transcriptional regulator
MKNNPGSITIRDIAKALKISVSTVSKALNASDEISGATKKLVGDYAKAHSYKPNRFARSLKAGQTSTIGVMVSSFSGSSFLTQALDGIYRAAFTAGYEVIIMQSFENEENERTGLESLLSRNVDGILLDPVSETSNTDYINHIHETICPVVVFDRINPGIKTIKVGVNEHMGALEAVTHLGNIGRKRILFITGDKFGDNNQRILGYKKALKQLDIPFNPRYMVQVNLENLDELDNKIKTAVGALRETPIKPNAIFGATDLITVRTLGILAEMEVSVPGEIAVTGFANTDLAFALNPALTCIKQPAKEMGELAVQKLTELLSLKAKGKKPAGDNQTLLLETSLQIRKSTLIVAPGK